MFLSCTLSLPVDFSSISAVHEQICTSSRRDSIHAPRTFCKAGIFTCRSELKKFECVDEVILQLIRNDSLWGVTRDEVGLDYGDLFS